MDSKEKKRLKQISHHLKPVINVGKNGVTDSLLDKIEDTLRARELIKIKILNNAPLNSREKLIKSLLDMGCEIIQEKGKIFTIFRELNEN